MENRICGLKSMYLGMFAAMRFRPIFSLGFLSAVYATSLLAEESANILPASQNSSLEALIAFTKDVTLMPPYVPSRLKCKNKLPETNTPAPPPSPFIKQFRFGMNADVLYFKPVQDNLKYAETNTISLSPPGKSLYQKFSYKLGFRLGVEIPIWYDNWTISSTYLYFHPIMPPARKTDNNQFLFMTLTQPYYPLVNNFLNVQCGGVKGSWRLRMDSLDLALKRAYQISRSFFIDPILGLQTAEIRQRIEVNYEDIYIINGSQPVPGNPLPIISPQKVVATSDVWGVGPELGAEFRFVIPREFNLFFKCLYSCMMGNFNTTTKYTDLLASTSVGISPNVIIVTVPQEGSSIMKESLARVFSVLQLQASLSKVWNLNQYGSFECMIGWETQLWWGQNRFNWYSTATMPSEGADLTLQGPFARMNLKF